MIFSAAAAYSSQVLGTAILYFAKRSLRYIIAMGPPSTGMAYTLLPSVDCFQAQSAYRALSSPAPYLPMSTSLSRITKLGISWNSTMATSGAPLPALKAVFSLAYWSGPVPTLVQSTLMSWCEALKASTTPLNSGYHAHTLMCTGPEALGSPEALSPAAEEPAAQPASKVARASAPATNRPARFAGVKRRCFMKDSWGVRLSIEC